jgi:hypothetical protein
MLEKNKREGHKNIKASGRKGGHINPCNNNSTISSLLDYLFGSPTGYFQTHSIGKGFYVSDTHNALPPP